MRRILLSCGVLAVLTLPSAATARATAAAKPGYLVISKAVGDGGVNGRPVATLVVKGFVLGRVSQEARVQIIQLPSAAGQGAPQVVGADVSSKSIKWRRFHGREYNGSNFRFRAMGGLYRLVVRGSGVYIFAGGRGQVTVRGSSVSPQKDGTYSVNGGTARSLPKLPVTRKIGRG
ncbi:MAG: hypothetical protein ACRDKC_05155 [Gaiellaceae bacterium]